MPTISAASTPSRSVTTRAWNMGNYENEFQFQFQLGWYRSQQVIFNENDLRSRQHSAVSTQPASTFLANSSFWAWKQSRG
jgi:hypothetical protein